MAGREPQGQVPGVADQPARDGDQPPPQGGDHGFAAADAVPVNDVLADGAGGELVQPGGHVRGEQRAPHPGHIDLGVSGPRALAAVSLLPLRGVWRAAAACTGTPAGTAGAIACFFVAGSLRR